MTATTIESLLQNLEGLPVPVTAWKVEAGEDHSGDDAVWVWVTLQETDLNRDNRETLRELVRRKLSELSKSWVYVRFRGASESIEE